LRGDLFTKVKRGLKVGKDDEKPNEYGFYIGGFHEVVFSVRDLSATSSFYREISGWEEVVQSKLPQEQLNFWAIDQKGHGQQCLLTCPGVGTGHMRLVQFDGVDQRVIRSNSQSWDVGGIYDIDLRSKDLDATYQQLVAKGWSGYSDPQTYEFDVFHVQEVLMKGPDDVVLAIIQRFQPPLEGYPHMRSLSHVFNSSQIVSDMEASKAFYMDILGFQLYKDMNLQGTDDDENLFGMPQNLYDKIERKICILHPQGTNQGSVELLELKGAEGRDFSAFANPPNLGILLLRFPVRGIQQLRDHLLRNEVIITRDIQELDISPYGKCQCLAIQTPDGAWLEFIESLET